MRAMGGCGNRTAYLCLDKNLAFFSCLRLSFRIDSSSLRNIYTLNIKIQKNIGWDGEGRIGIELLGDGSSPM